MADLIRVGILGPGRIVRRVMTDFHNAQGVCLMAVASRSLARAQEAAQQYGAKYAFGSYEELAACDEVDLVYVATPHPFHCEHAILMMSHGKHVLCEKPMALDEAQTLRMTQYAKEHGVFLMEAMWTRFFPAMDDMRARIAAGEIGEIRHIFSVFSGSNQVDPESRLYNPALAGGAMLDIGVYPLMACTDLLGWQPEKVQGLYRVTETGVDGAMSVQLQYAGGATAQIMTAFDAASPSQLQIYGTKGHIVMPEFWRPTAYELTTLAGETTRHAFRPENEGHHYEFEEAARCIREGLTESPRMTHEESVAIARITQALRHEAGVFYPGETAHA